jgi:hypothetical protein
MSGQSRGKKVMWMLGSSVLAVALLAWLLRDVSWSRLAAQAQAVPVWVWFASVCGMVCSHVLRAGRLREEWSGVLHLHWHTAWALLVRHSAWVVIAPMRAGEAVYVWALHRQGGVPISDAALSLLKLRLQDIAVLGSLACLIWLPLPLAWRASAALAALAAAIWLFPWLWQLAVARVQPARATSLAPVRWRAWAFALSNWLVKLMALGLPLAMLTQTSAAAAFAGALGGEFGAALPVQPPAGLGPYEAGIWTGVQLWLALPSLAATPATAPLDLAAAALVVHFLALAVTLASATVASLVGWSAQNYPRCIPLASNS